MPIRVEDGRLYEKIAEMQLKMQPEGQEIRRVLTRIGIRLEGDIKRNIRRIDLIDTGTLLNSIKYQLVKDRTAGVLQVGSFGVPYARIHEYGGVIKPTRSKWLTIPIHERSKRRFARDFDLRFFKNPKTGKLLAADAVNGDLLFFLTKRVKIKPKRYIKKALDNNKSFIFDTIRELAR